MILDKSDLALLEEHGCDSLAENVPDCVYHAGFKTDLYRIEIARDLLTDGKPPQSRHFAIGSLIFRRLANGEYRLDSDIPATMGADSPKIALFNALRAIGLSLR